MSESFESFRQEAVDSNVPLFNQTNIGLYDKTLMKKYQTDGVTDGIAQTVPHCHCVPKDRSGRIFPEM